MANAVADAGEGGVTHEHFVEENAERPVIGELVVSLRQHHLRSHVIGGAARRVRALASHESTTETEICEFNVTVGVDEDVFGFQIVI